MIYFEDEKIIDDLFSSKKFNLNDDILHIITVVSSPFGQDKRTQLAQEFIYRIEELEKEKPCILYVVEIIYENQSFLLHLKNPKHLLQIELPNSCILWNKENMINVAVKQLLPNDWKYMAWIDADIEFKNKFWIEDTLQTFKSKNADILQLFSYCRFLNKDNIPQVYWFGAIFQYIHKQMGYPVKYFWQSGFAWACSKKAYEQMNGLFDYAIVGAGDHIMKNSFIGMSLNSFNAYKNVPGLYKKIIEFYHRVCGFRCWYVDGIIVHFYHGEKKKRMYDRRISILEKHNYNPDIHLDNNNILQMYIPSHHMSFAFQQDIHKYFLTRQESSG